MRKQLLDFVAKRGTLIEPKAADYLLEHPNPIEYLSSIMNSLTDQPLVLTLKDVLIAENIASTAAKKAITHQKEDVIPRPSPEIFKNPATPVNSGAAIRMVESAKNVEEDIVVLKDITGHSTCEGKIDDFSKYFLSRYQTLSAMLRQHRELVASMDITRAKRLSRDVSVIGMVCEVRTTRNGHRIIGLEDETDRISVLLPASSSVASAIVVTDEVIGVQGKINNKGLLIANNIIKPDIPTNHRGSRSVDQISIAFISDIHVGSKSFLEGKWGSFQKWITNGDELARSIKYIVIDGDLVDGIGIYPRQDEDLAIEDIYTQYEHLAKLIEELPSHISTILIPGNHDAVRPAEPQPALPESIRKLFPSNVLFVGNPCLFRIHGIRILAYHGRSMDDLVSTIPSLSYSRPLDAMIGMLRMRHLAPIYGGRTPIAPEAQDFLVIEEVPDVFVTGHVHGVGVGEYRGVTLINSSAWQSQTSYQKMRNLEPQPARVPVLNLFTGTMIVKEF